MQTAKLHPHFLRGAAVIAARGDIRYYLNGVCVEIGERETFYVATDGHKLVTMRAEIQKDDPPQVPATYIIPHEAIDSMPRKFKEPVRPTVEFHYDPTATGVECRLGNFMFKPVEGKFPDWRKIVPKEVSGARGSYNPHYMMAFHKAAKIALGSDLIPDLWSNGPEGTALVLVEHYSDFLGLLMPLRQHSAPQAPAWAAPRPAPVPAPAPANAPEVAAAAE